MSGNNLLKIKIRKTDVQQFTREELMAKEREQAQVKAQQEEEGKKKTVKKRFENLNHNFIVIY